MIVIDEKFKKEIGKRLYALRKEKGLTREELIDELNSKYYLNIDERTLRRYESGTYMPKIDNLISISEYFGVSLDYLIYGRRMSDDDSFTWKDTLKRLNRLIYSCVLLPYPEEDKNSSFYGKYYFAAYDDEIAVYMERLESFTKKMNYKFETRGRPIQFDVTDLDKLIEDFEEYPESLVPSKKRIENLLVAAHEDPEEFIKRKIEAIVKKRKNK